MSVKDQGIGISKMAQKRVFEEFYREHTGDVHNVKGHGLGLANVKRIVDNHQGSITVESEKDNGKYFYN
jgi:two-component system phosphate regulon sensor histidine kinase PhoR